MQNKICRSKSCLIAFLILVIVVSGCAGAGNIQADLDKEFTLSIGQVAVVKGADLQVRFLEVTGDSRCPADVTCIWQGEVTCNIELKKGSNSSNLSLTQPGLSDKYAGTQYQGYILFFKVSPYPRSGQKITLDMYRLHMIISKTPWLTL